MAQSLLHRFERDGRHFVLDTDTCFCFECDGISWDVLEHYPHTPTNHIVYLLRDAHPAAEVEEVVGELEWLRATKSILPQKKPQDQLKAYELTPGMRRVEVVLDGSSRDSAQATALCEGALVLLLGRSGPEKSLRLELYVPDAQGLSGWFPDWSRRAFGLAKIADKSLAIAVVFTNPAPRRANAALAGHEINLCYSFSTADGVSDFAGNWSKAEGASMTKLARLAEKAEGVDVELRLVPGHGDFCDAVVYLLEQGFKQIYLDIPGAYMGVGGLDAAAMTAGIEATAVYYAQQLLKGNYFRLEPIAGLFHQIYEGKAQARTDESGTRILAIDSQGDIYPSRYFIGVADYHLGNILAGSFDESRRAEFDDLGAATTSACVACWARNLCGGGHSAIHYALSGGIRQPNPAWCDAQRTWFSAAIAAFNLLSAEGVDFARMYQRLRPGKRPSFWGMARMALTMKVAVRPIEESDATLLTRWENWSEATYFLGNEYGVFLATRYDREMDSLHPRGIEQEFMVVSRRGEAMGLLKVRPDQVPGVARVWIFFQDTQGYLDKGIRNSFARILAEAAKHGAFTTLIAASGPGDGALGEFFSAIGFEHVGTEREALFLHDAYHDIAMHRLVLDG